MQFHLMRWWVVLILCTSALVFSLAYGCSELTVFSSLQDIRVCRRNWVIWQIIYDFQGLIAGLLAILAAWIGAAALRNQTKHIDQTNKIAAATRHFVKISIIRNLIIPNNAWIVQDESLELWKQSIDELATIDAEFMWASFSVYINVCEFNKDVSSKANTLQVPLKNPSKDRIAVLRTIVGIDNIYEIQAKIQLLTFLSNKCRERLESGEEFQLEKRMFDGSIFLEKDAKWRPNDQMKGIFTFFRWPNIQDKEAGGQ